MTPREQVDLELKAIEEVFDRQKVLDPMVVFVKGNHRAIVQAEFHNYAHKDIVSEGIKDLVKRSEPDLVIYFAEAWMTVVKKYKEGVTIRPTYSPDRIEIVVAQIEFKTGEKFSCQARIIREKGTARLDKFEVSTGGMSMGRFVDFFPITRTN